MIIKTFLCLLISLPMAIIAKIPSQQNLQTMTTETLNHAKQYEATAVVMKSESNAYASAHKDKADQVKALAKARWLEAMETLKLKNYDQQRLGANREQFQGPLLFVSLGMPRAALKALIKQADRLHIPVLIQGVLSDGFMATVNKMTTLVTPVKKEEKPTGGIVIEPNWFKHFGITQVPAFVMTDELMPCITKNCKVAEYDVLYGNISLYEALRVFAQKGSPAFQVKAHGLLERLKGQRHD